MEQVQGNIGVLTALVGFITYKQVFVLWIKESKAFLLFVRPLQKQIAGWIISLTPCKILSPKVGD